jgi:hypothetical protein
MENRSGYALAFKSANDSLTFVLPAATISRLAATATLSVALKLFVEGGGQGTGNPIGWGHKGNAFGQNILVGLVQSWERCFAWSAGEWDRPPAGPAINIFSPNVPAHNKAFTLVSAVNLSQAMPFGAWYQLEFALTPTTASFFINGKLVASSAAYNRCLDGGSPLNFTIGGFDGFIDDVAISSVVRA